MRKFNKPLAVILTAVLVLLSLGLVTSAEGGGAPAAGGELKVLSYNVDGLPLLYLKNNRNPWKDSRLISAHFAEGHYDLIGVQEDFNCHRQLTSRLGDVMPYRSVHRGGIAVGGGQNVFSKYPIYNQRQLQWESSFGVFSGSTDELTPKGFLHTVACLTGDPDGPKVDFFTLHADAGSDPDSTAAREANYRQLAAYINENCAGRAVIITGDFNSCLTEGRLPHAKLVTELVPGLRDSWQELYDQGLYAGKPGGVRRGLESGDSIDRVMLRDGDGISFTVLESYNLTIQRLADGSVAAAEDWLDGTEKSLADHAARFARLSWEYDEAEAADYGELAVPRWSFRGILWEQLKSFFRVLGTIIAEPFKLLIGLFE
ncbi:MAG: endonuclease/exonuclease/phosphatase family protein [Oscillospiraceae bacterium]|nr:endonuclease/exonuclease/phosphatase family protein [Oscillospiraceae bacterium]